MVAADAAVATGEQHLAQEADWALSMIFQYNGAPKEYLRGFSPKKLDNVTRLLLKEAIEDGRISEEDLR